MPGSNVHFEKVLNVAEKSVEAWSKAYNKIEEHSKNIERLAQDLKDLDNLIRQKPCITETVQYGQLETKLLDYVEEVKTQQLTLSSKLDTFEKDTKDLSKLERQITLWLRLATGAVVLIGTTISIVLAVAK
jgi:DNA repair exonuclease SbcCD ATPase subunit